jgi:F0F1-type ATP synthase membrane subunit b/b'
MSTMKLQLAAILATFAIVVTVAVFAIWPAVGDAPWEDNQTPTPCTGLGCRF